MYSFSAGLKRNAPFLQLFKKYAEKPAFAQLLYRAAFHFRKGSYMQSLSKCDRRKVQQKGSRTAFKFGGGRMLKSEGEYWLPVVIAGKEVTVRTEVVQSDIPLLLSREAMKKAGVKIDLGKDTVTIFGEDQVLKITSSGHCCVPIGRGVPIGREEVVSDKLYKTNKNVTVDCLEKKWFHMRSTQFEDSNEHLQKVTDRNVITRETQGILGKAVNDNAKAKFLIMNCPRKATEKDIKRQIHMTQHQLKKESRWDAENNQSRRDQDKKEGHSIQEGVYIGVQEGGVPNDEQLENSKAEEKIFIFKDFSELLGGRLAFLINFSPLYW